MAEADKLTQEQKAAAVIVSLGVDKASKLYKHLGQEDLERLTVEIARLGHIEAETTETVLDEFYKECLTQKVVTDGGIEYARTVLEKAFGEETANTLLQKVSKSLKVMPFAFLSKTNSKNLFSILQHERPQTIALVLSYVEPTQAADVIVMLPDEMKLRVVTNIAKMDSASPEAIKLVEAEMQKKFSTILTTDFTHVGGVDYIAEVMNNMDRSNEKSIFEGLNREDEELSAEIRKKMFVFEDILTMDARSIQRFLRDCDQKDLVLALKGTTAEVANVIFANVSSRMAENIKSDLEITVNVRLQDVEEAQQRIVQIIRTLEDRGEVVIMKGGKGDIIA
ncbi:MAG: flagellar motor switch protein FliG [Anaerotignum sp.]|jgi:flagellar motor switch protein FliG|nr:flagellar motor switch protein FliG [Anaerotignum sp.]MCI8866710.1 flagellar motor switch protein FliG [Anaerotignum sp.]